MPLTRIGAALWTATLISVLLGATSGESVLEVLTRTAPVLGFAVAITMVADVAFRSGVFTSLAEWLARVAGHRRWVLFGGVMALAVVCTAFLSLDTTAVLLTPIVVLLAQHTRSAAMPFALATVWLANTSSLTLPVSNLTNLLASHELGNPSPGEWLRTFALPSLAAVLVTCGALVIVSRRHLRGRYDLEERTPTPDRALWWVTVLTLAALLPALLLPVAPWIPATAAAIALIVAAAARRSLAATQWRAPWRDVPWALVVFASGLFVAADAIEQGVLSRLTVPGPGDGAAAVFAASGIAMVAANLVDNLPAYLILEPLTTSPLALKAVLIGVNVGPLITPWASLATLLWHRQLSALGVEVPWKRYVMWGAVVAPLSVLAATGALLAVS
ncbi:SLC13 family permease [Demequina sp.]|uniref:SLC13 family permease n=1 Tax=Demequina sp. TaxID=2050685 RepID=UPI003D11A35F